MVTKIRIPELEGPDDAWENGVQASRTADLSNSHFRWLCDHGEGPPSYPRANGQKAFRRSDVLRWKRTRRGPGSNGH